MSSEYETARKRIEELNEWYKSNEAQRNEATTRLHLVDELLFECLGWDKRSDCTAEERLNGTYTDYSLKCPRLTLIVEAKKEGTYFDIPIGKSNRQYKISTLCRDLPELGDAIDQVANYSQQRGSPLCMVTNGHQLVAFIGSRQDGVPPIEGQALVFESLDSMVSNFKLLWHLLSKQGIISRHLWTQLMGEDRPVLPRKMSETISGYPGSKQRNEIQTNLQILAEIVFEDIVESPDLEEEFLARCYCESGPLSQYALISKSLLSQRYSALFPDDKQAPTLVQVDSKKQITPEILAESSSRRPILVIGDVGVGKTIFFRHFIRVKAKEIFGNAIVLYLSFGSKAESAENLFKFIVDEIQKQLFEKYGVDVYEDSFVRAVYHGDLIRFEKTIYKALKNSDPRAYEQKVIELLDNKLSKNEQFMQNALEHITKGRRQQIIVFLDNADQRPDDLQQELFVASGIMAANWPVTVFLALRPETFQRSRQKGVMKAYHLKAFTVLPPRIDKVLEKRLDFGLEITSGRIPASCLPSGISVDFQKVGAFLSIVKYTLDQSFEIVESVDNLASGNVREALNFIKRLIGSGHIDTRKILEIYEKKGRYLIPLHEFLRAIIYGDTAYFDSENSPIENLFDIVFEDRREHFLSLILLEAIAHMGRKSSKHGFIGFEEVCDYVQGIGYSVDQINIHLDNLWKKQLIETAGRVKPIGIDITPSALRITTIGAYHLDKLPRMFVYYDAIVTETYILDREFRELILDVTDIAERLDRGLIFLDYLEKCFKLIDLTKCRIGFQSQLADVRRDIENIKRRTSH